MTTRALYLVTCFGLALLPLAGCTISIGPVVWTDEVTQELRIDTAGLARLEAHTYNGAISYTGHADYESAAVVLVTKRAGGLTIAGAQAALEALEVYVEPRGDGTSESPGVGRRRRASIGEPG